MSHESCPSTRSTWLLTRKAIFLPLHLFPSAPIKGRAASLEGNYLRWTTWQFVTSFSQPSLKVNSVTHLTEQYWKRTPLNRANPMAFFFYWILTPIPWIKKTTILVTKLQAFHPHTGSIHHIWTWILCNERLEENDWDIKLQTTSWSSEEMSCSQQGRMSDSKILG